MIVNRKKVFQDTNINQEILNRVCLSRSFSSRINDYSDTKLIKRLLRHYEFIKQHTYKSGNYDLVNIILDLDYAIKYCHLSDGEYKNIMLWKQGYTENEIGNILGIFQSAVHRSLDNACNKISKKLVGMEGNVFKN